MNKFLDILDRCKFSDIYRASQIDKILKRDWSQVEDEMSHMMDDGFQWNKLKYDFFCRGKVIICVKNPVWITEFEQYKDRMIQILNSKLGSTEIKKIQIKYNESEIND